MLYKHYNDYTGPWPYQHFSKKEVSCKHCGEFYLDDKAMSSLEGLRHMWGKPIVINSAHRCKEWNADPKVDGVKNSPHLKIAFDCAMPKAEQEKFITQARRCGFSGIGRYAGFVHIDTGRSREWTG